MFYANRPVRRAASSGKVLRVDRPGVAKASRHEYRGFHYEVGRRRLGMTVAREQFSATIFDAAGRRLAFLSPLASSRSAIGAAERWIDREIQREEEMRQRQWRAVERALMRQRASENA